MWMRGGRTCPRAGHRGIPYNSRMSIPIERIFANWDRAPLPQAAEIVLSRAPDRGPGPIDLCDVLCVVPGSRSGRLLLSQLASVGQERGRSIIPPRVITPGAIIDELAEPGGGDRDSSAVVATPIARLMAWATSLDRCDEPDRRWLGLPGTKGRATLGERIEVAQALIGLADDLAAERRTFADARAAAARLAGEEEADRFAAAMRVSDLAASMLESCGFAEPSRSQSLRAAGATPRTGGPRRLVLVATIELNGVQRSAVAAFASRGGEVLVIAHGDERWRSRLDELGCIVPGPWVDEPCEIRDDEIVIAERGADAAQCVIDAIASVATERSADEITIGLVDGDLGSLVEQSARWAGVSLRAAAGRALPTTSPWQTIDALARGASDDETIIRLARIPSIADAMRRRGVGATAPTRDLLEALDEGRRAARPGGERCDAGVLAAARHALAGLFAPLEGAPRPLDAWGAPLRAVLAEALVDGGQPGGEESTAAPDATSIVAEAIQVIAQELASWAELPAALAPIVDGWTAMTLLAERTGRLSVPLPRRRGEIDVLGWLELHLDDAPVLILAGAHEGRLPRPVPRESMGLMPDSLRAELGIVDGRAFACRDAYLFEAMRRGRAVSRMIAARRDASGAPLLASRFLVRAPPGESAARLRRVACAATAVRIVEPRGLSPAAAASGFIVPPAPPGPIELDRIAVTAFKAYLACPYRFWLRFVVGLQAVEPPGRQLGPDEFGTLAHEVLRRFGEDASIRDSTSVERIAAFLDSMLDAEVHRHFGAHAPVAVRVQAARLRERLASFAALQAERRCDGWHVDRVEWPLPSTALLAIDGEQSIRVTGRIDRVDRHDDGRVMLLDYKTADTSRSPRQAHRGVSRRGVVAPWIDLQLPLYAHLWQLVQGGSMPETGYVALPRDPADVEVRPFDLDNDELDDAIDNARVIVSLMRRGAFAPASEVSGRDDFATICHARSLGRVLGGDDGGPALDADGGGDES